MKAKNSCTLIGVMVLLSVVFNSTPYAQEKTYPERPIQILVPHSAGGGVTTLIRLLSEELTNTWKVRVNVLNKPGGGGAVAAGEVAYAAKDGYTILGILESLLVAMSVANPSNIGHVLRDFDPIAVHYAYAPNVLVTHSDSPYKTLEDVIDYAKKNPGKLVCGSAGIGQDVTLEVMQLNRAAKVDIKIMHFEGTAEVTTNVLGKHLPLGMIGYIPARPHVAAGKMRILASDAKSPTLDAPTFAEKGYPEVNVVSSIAFLAPKGTPPTVIKVWEDAIQQILKRGKFTDDMIRIGYGGEFLLGSENLDKYFKEEVKNFSLFTPEELGWKK